MTMQLDPNYVARVLGGEAYGNTVRAPAPGHSLKDRSLAITIDASAPDGFLVHTFSPRDDPIAAKDYVRERIGRPPWKPPAKGNGAGANGHAAASEKVVARYVYQTADGENYLRVSRTASKRFWQERWNGAAWEKGKPQGPKIPYRLPEMQGAVHDTVIIVEGEKDVDRLIELGFVATTASEGAGKWTDDLAQWFEHKTIYIVADKDEPGRKHAQQVAANLYPAPKPSAS